MVIVELGEVREARPFRDDEADELAALSAVDLADEEIDQPFQNDPDRQAGRRRRFDIGDERDQHRGHQFPKQRLLSRKCK